MTYEQEMEELRDEARRLAAMVRADQRRQQRARHAEKSKRRGWTRADLWMSAHAPEDDPGSAYRDYTQLSPELQAQRDRSIELRARRRPGSL
jgi:hypothetical protein